MACLSYVLTELDFGRLWSLIKGINPLYLVAVNLIYAMSFVARTWRWQLLIQPVKPSAFAPLFSANIIGFMANDIMPARVGEVVRAWVGARLTGAPLSGTLATIVVERMLDGPVLLAFMFSVLYFVDPSAKAGNFSVGYLKAAGYSLLIGYVLLLLGLAAVVRWPAQVIGFIYGIIIKINRRLADRLRKVLLIFSQGLTTLRETKTLVPLILLSVAVRLPIFMMHYVFLPAVGLPRTIYMAAMATLGHGVACTVPSGPGYIGTYQLAVFWTLLLAGAPKKAALAYSLIYWAAQYFPLVAAGLIETYRQGLRFSTLRHKGEELAGDLGSPA